MIPIEKNISVIDEQGNEYEATYLKRAKGLVKNGRARFVSENRICLACPPDKLVEDKIMSEIKEISIDSKTADCVDTNRYSFNYALEQIQKIQESTSYLDKAINELQKMEIHDGIGDIANQAKAQAIADVVKCRETTNQRLLDFYINMINDMKPQSISENNTRTNLNDVTTWLKNLNREDYDIDAWSALLEAVKGLLSRN